MINVKDKLCPCGKRAYFGEIGTKIPKFCKNCKSEEMVNVKDNKCPCGK